MRIGRATRNVDVHGKDRVHAADSGVVLAEDTAAATAGADGDYQPRSRHRVISFPEGEFHVAGDGAGHEQHVGVTWRRHEVDAKALDVVNRTVQANDFYLAAVAGAGVHFADMQ